MQDIEFTIDDGRLWMLQTRSGKRTIEAAIRIAVDMAEEGLISREEAVLRVRPARSTSSCTPRSTPLPKRTSSRRACQPSPGAAAGEIVFDADEAEALQGQGPPGHPRAHGDQPGGHPRHARRGGHPHRARRHDEPRAVVARGMGRPCICGAAIAPIDAKAATMTVGKAGVPARATSSRSTAPPARCCAAARRCASRSCPATFAALMTWADSYRRLGVRANADTPRDAPRRATSAPRASGCAAPSTCSSTRSASCACAR